MKYQSDYQYILTINAPDIIRTKIFNTLNGKTLENANSSKLTDTVKIIWELDPMRVYSMKGYSYFSRNYVVELTCIHISKIMKMYPEFGHREIYINIFEHVSSSVVVPI